MEVSFLEIFSNVGLLHLQKVYPAIFAEKGFLKFEEPYF
jgi:hypothetical protein